MVHLLLDAGVRPNRLYNVSGTAITALDAAIDALAEPSRRDTTLPIAEAIATAGGKAYGIDSDDYQRIVAYGTPSLRNAMDAMLLFDESGAFIPTLPLWEAIARNDYGEVMLSIRAGADPNEKIAGYSPLAIAFYTHRYYAAEALIDAGADPTRL